MKKLISAVVVISFCSATAEVFKETTPVYGVIKPGKISTLLAVNHGMVSEMSFQVGDSVRFGSTLLQSIERETTRSYRSTINGKVAKIHVTVGAALTPGMPLITVIDPSQKVVEVSLSPEESRKIKIGAEVYRRGESDTFGTIEKISPLVDPDTGGVISYIKPKKSVSYLIGDVIPVSVHLRDIKDCKVVKVSEVNKFTSDFKVEATSGGFACLIGGKKKQQEE